MRRRELVINGLPLANDSVGTGVYGRRVVRSLIAHQTALANTVVVVAPNWVDLQLNGGVPVARLGSARAGHPLLDEALWSNRLGAWAVRRDTTLFSPAPFWSASAPEDTVVFQHDRIHHFFPQYLGRWGVRKALMRRAETFLGRCRFVITHSEHSRADIARIPGVRADRIRVIRPWLPEEYTPDAAARLAPIVRAKYRLPERFWVYVGGYDYRKNVELLIGAYGRVVSARDVPHLVLAGHRPPSGPLYCDLERAILRAGVPANRVSRPGFIAANDMPGLFGAAELMIYPSRYEGFGLPPMEAMGCGCPTICADNSSLPEVVRDRDYRFRDDDERGLADLLACAVPSRLPFNPSFSRDDFSEKMSIAAYVTLFNELAGS